MMDSKWDEQWTPSRPRITPAWLDGIPLAIMLVLANDAWYYLRFGDMRWWPWYRWFVMPGYMLELATLAAVCCVAIAGLCRLGITRWYAYPLAIGATAALWWIPRPEVTF